ncbi:hypothetical protein R1sor_005327 [Riccia sorocarpa]|uniref:MULE transposase domain-containing protein n=1 Tax=Riccia sorocarpa TaxID=122646 RepID=A0ABD3HNG8_9MARC
MDGVNYMDGSDIEKTNFTPGEMTVEEWEALNDHRWYRESPVYSHVLNVGGVNNVNPSILENWQRSAQNLRGEMDIGGKTLHEVEEAAGRIQLTQREDIEGDEEDCDDDPKKVGRKTPSQGTRCEWTRSICQDIISGCQQQSFSQILSLCARISEVDPSAVVDWHRFDGTCVFMRAFVCPSACRNVLRYCQKIACFTKNKKYPTQLFIATTVDGNSEVPLAYALAPTENYENWRWFLQNLMASIDGLESPNVIIVSDRQKGLEKAVAHVLPRNFHMHCAHHLKMNVQKHFGTTAGKAFLTLVYMNSQAIYERRLVEMETGVSKGPDLVRYIRQIPMDRYVRFSIPLPRYGMMTSNAVECINGALKPIRDYAPYENEALVQTDGGLKQWRLTKVPTRKCTYWEIQDCLWPCIHFVTWHRARGEDYMRYVDRIYFQKSLVQCYSKTIPLILQTELPMSVACRAPPAAIRNERQRIVRILNGGSAQSAESEYSYLVHDDPAMNPAAVMTNVPQEDAVERGNPLVPQSVAPQGEQVSQAPPIARSRGRRCAEHVSSLDTRDGHVQL